MKKLLVSFILMLSVFKASADEGMWLPMLLGQQVYDNMVKRGLKLSKEQLYNINKPSIKDAIIIFGGGCTGEIVSSQGLIFTNHHCGYGAIADASSVEKNILKNGFYAKNKDEEIKTNLTVQFLDKIVDVTVEVENNLKGLNWTDRNKKTIEVFKSITDKVDDASNGVHGKVYSMFKGNQFILYVYKTYRDVRLVGTPPESFGKFGGDTDNWEWPRHTSDFAVFRVYATKDGKPAEYSKDNVPLKPKWFLPISLKGYKDGDYAMVYGFPGSTNRYETSYGLKLKMDIENPSLVNLRDARLKYMLAEMVKDPAVKLKLASSYAQIANYWKFFEGETKQLKKYRVYERKQKYEQDFIQWATNKAEYQNIFNDYQKNYSAWTPFAKQRQYLIEGILGSPLAAFASSMQQLGNSLSNKLDIKNALAAADAARKKFLEGEDIASDRKIVATTAMMFYTDVDKSQHPKAFYEEIQKTYGDLTEEATYTAWAKNMFANSIFINDDKWKAFMDNSDAATLQNDPAYTYAVTFIRNYYMNYAKAYSDFISKNNELGRLYMKGIMEIDPVAAKKMYPDANFSMRVSYGNVKSYKPRDAVHYDYVTTSKGILEKYVPGDYEFDLPEDAVKKLSAKDFGQYIDKVKNDLVACFITTNDITGGNSGSPVIDANGNLIGLAFDGNYESMDSQLNYDKDLNRCINVDVRYVLWCIDKLGGAKNIIEELKLVR